MKLSSKGQVVLPLALRAKYNLRAGDTLQVRLAKDTFTVVPPMLKKRKARIVKDPMTGLPCITLGPGAPVITKEMVDKLLEDFP